MSETDPLPADPRLALAALAARGREELSSLSRLIGRNPSYIQQYVRRGSPRRLAEQDRRTLAAYFGVEDAVLGGPAPLDDGAMRATVAVPRLDLAASAGPGALPVDEARVADLRFPAAMLRQLGARAFAMLALLRVRGDSMLPALGDGDDILVDRDDAGDRLRDGVYVLRHEEALLVKRVRLRRGGLAVLSDNRAYPSWPDADPARFEVIGRVLWSGGRLR